MSFLFWLRNCFTPVIRDPLIATAPAPARPFFARPCFVDDDRPVVEHIAVELVDRLLALCVVRHLNEGKALAPACELVRNDVHGGYLAHLREEVAQVFRRRLEWQVADVQSLRHCTLLKLGCSNVDREIFCGGGWIKDRNEPNRGEKRCSSACNIQTLSPRL